MMATLSLNNRRLKYCTVPEQNLKHILTHWWSIDVFALQKSTDSMQFHSFSGWPGTVGLFSEVLILVSHWLNLSWNLMEKKADLETRSLCSSRGFLTQTDFRISFSWVLNRIVSYIHSFVQTCKLIRWLKESYHLEIDCFWSLQERKTVEELSVSPAVLDIFSVQPKELSVP